MLAAYTVFLHLFIAAEKASKANVPSNLIPRPRGAVGRSSGYNLQEAMGLEENTGQYLRVGVSFFHQLEEYMRP
jgi:hypothetical protein